MDEATSPCSCKAERDSSPRPLPQILISTEYQDAIPAKPGGFEYKESGMARECRIKKHANRLFSGLLSGKFPALGHSGWYCRSILIRAPARAKSADPLRGRIVGILRRNRKDRAYKRTNRYARHDRQRSATTHDRYIRNMREPIGRVPMKSSGVPGERLWTLKAGIVGNYAFRTAIQYGEVVHGWTHCLMTESGETPRRELCDQHIRCARYRYGHLLRRL